MPPEVCLSCQWVLDAEGVCTNPHCETVVVEEEPKEAVGHTVIPEPEPPPLNRAERRGYAVGRHRKVVPPRAREEGKSTKVRTDRDRARTRAQKRARKKAR